MFVYIKKFKKTFISLTVFLFFFFILSQGHNYKKEELKYGLTFSKKQAQNLNLDWKKVYLAIFSDLKVKKIRLPAYWDEIETSSNQYFWDDMDWQIEQAEKAQAEIILAIGGRLPRWPECHFPEWTNNITEKQREKAILIYIKKIIERYKNNQAIKIWQVENEPFLSHFGDCPTLNSKFLDQEIALVKNLDNRPIMVTDSGELSFWIPAAKRADIFGTSLYLHTYSRVFKNYINYPITPSFFHFKRNITKIFAHPKEWIVIELQAEPWGRTAYQNLTQNERDRTMNLEKFKNIINFSSKSSFQQFYLWGVEWWYWEKIQDRPEMWQEAKKLFHITYEKY